MLAVVAALILTLQDDVPPPQADIEQAIKRGSEALLARAPEVLAGKVAVNFGPGYEYDPLLLYTLVHSGIPLENETLKALTAKVFAATLHRTYQAALTAAALAAVDPVKYQDKLVQCAQYLVDFQGDNGQWSYGDTYDLPLGPGKAGANQTISMVRIKRLKKLGPAAGDNSNSQYAALGLKACAAGGCEIEPATLTRAIEWWEKSQQKNGGWGYDTKGAFQPRDGTYGSMTAGAVSSLIMLKQLKKLDPKLSPVIARGFAWMEGHFTVEENPDAPPGLEDWRYYYLYAVERAGDLYPTEKIGKRAWYAAGAAHLLKTQRSDGMWISKNSNLTVADTCFALLFLERVARRAPVATGGK